jgi:glyoxylase-like metal-dependent hydrolase (beta-lactamase superfamily II)
MLFRQFLDRESCTFTYLIAKDYNSPAAIIDPVIEHIDLYNQFIEEFELDLVYCIETHTHADHITGSGLLSKKHGSKIVVGAQSQAQPVDIHISDQQKLTLGNLTITALYTPGHTDDSYSYLCEGRLFSGDTLLIRGSGRTDFQSGSPQQEYESITTKLLTLPDETLVYPAHDYKVLNVSTIGEEKRFNPRLQAKNADDYAKIMDNLNLTRPQKMDIAVPANLKCGLLEKKHE